MAIFFDLLGFLNGLKVVGTDAFNFNAVGIPASGLLKADPDYVSRGKYARVCSKR